MNEPAGAHERPSSFISPAQPGIILHAPAPAPAPALAQTQAQTPTHWPGWRHLPRETRDTLFLLAVIGWTVLPHIGHLPLWCTLLTATMLAWRAALALTGEPLPGRWLLVAVLLVAVALTWWSYGTVAGKEAGITLLVVLVALKTLELRARRDAFAVFFLGFFLVLTHFLYSQSLAIAAATIVSVWGLLTALVLAHMPVGRPALRQAAALAGRFALLGAPVMAILFVLFPRVGPLWGLPKDAGASTGLSGELRLGGIAELALDDSIAMRVRFIGEGPTPPPSALYFRGPVLAAFDGRVWRMLASSRTADDDDATTDEDIVRPIGPGVDYELTLEPLRLTTIPVLDATPALELPQGAPRVHRRDALQWQADKPIVERLRFTAHAWPRFRYGPTTFEPALQQDLRLPAGRNPRMLAWAGELRQRLGERASAHAVAAAIFEHIRDAGYTYTLTPGAYDEDGTGNAVDEFWFDRKQGFCEHFASAFVVAMRAAGVPARIVTGYQGAERAAGGVLVVRQSYAHAWAEYWQAGQGWVRADPTAQVAPERIERSRPLAAPRGLVERTFDGLAPGLLVRTRALWEGVNQRWNEWVLNYSRHDQYDMLQGLGFQTPSWQTLGLVLIGVVVAFSLAAAAWAWWDHRRVDPWLHAFARVRRAARERGLPGNAFLAPRALALALEQAYGAEVAAPAVRSLQALERLRYGRAAARRGGHRSLARHARHLARDAVRALQVLERARIESPSTETPSSFLPSSL